MVVNFPIEFKYAAELDVKTYIYFFLIPFDKNILFQNIQKSLRNRQ